MANNKIPEEDRVRINLHEFDSDKDSIINGFMEAAEIQGWDKQRIRKVVGQTEGLNVEGTLNILMLYTVADYFMNFGRDENDIDDDYDEDDDGYYEEFAQWMDEDSYEDWD